MKPEVQANVEGQIAMTLRMPMPPADMSRAQSIVAAYRKSSQTDDDALRCLYALAAVRMAVRDAEVKRKQEVTR